LTINALIAACNQKSNREPVMEMGEHEIEERGGRLVRAVRRARHPALLGLAATRPRRAIRRR